MSSWEPSLGHIFSVFTWLLKYFDATKKYSKPLFSISQKIFHNKNIKKQVTEPHEIWNIMPTYQLWKDDLGKNWSEIEHKWQIGLHFYIETWSKNIETSSQMHKIPLKESLVNNINAFKQNIANLFYIE